ncbi:APC family permease [Candidatus Sumerlaeota bacterium]|nr:APC family permease [Candidatus Sumerlaeota bacterium]
MSNMVGVGPFITIPVLMSAMGGPQAMLGWFCAALITIPDSLVWSELGAAMPGSGGSYVYLREGFGRERWGRLMAFLFIWQFIISGPMEIASGYIGFANYLNYIWPGLSSLGIKLIAAGLGVANILLLYRRITSVSKLTVALWIGMILTTAFVIVTGVPHFDPKVAFDFPPGAFRFTLGFFMGLGLATQTGIYDYLGYYDVCYIGDEVKDPGRVIPRSIIISLIGVAAIYFTMNLSIIGVVPWREFVPADNNPSARYVVSLFMEKIYGHTFAVLFTLMILWTAMASLFALLLGYSRIPYVAARDGFFFKAFGRLHADGFPSTSLLTIGVIAIGCSFFSLDTVISALVSIRILVQFVGQIAALTLLRRNQPDMPRPYKMWLYPLPSFIALAGWIFVFVTTNSKIMLGGLGALAAGLVVFLGWSSAIQRWPFEAPVLAGRGDD